MSFANLSGLAVAGGCVALAFALFLLQRLRVRHRRVPVVTTLFWQEAIEEARARRLVRRFRHPWAYALILCLSLLLWMAMAEPQAYDDALPYRVVLLDASAATGAGAMSSQIATALEGVLASLPAERRSVIRCGADPSTLLADGEPAVLIAERLAGRLADAAPSTLGRTLLEVVRAKRGVTEVFLVGPSRVEDGVLDRLPADVTVKRVALPARTEHNEGVVVLGVATAASGRFDTVDLLAEIVTSDDGAPRATIDGVAAEVAVRDASRSHTWRWSDVPASGGIFEVQVASADALVADDRARLTLPRRERISVAIAPDVPAVLREALALDPALRLTDGDADVVVRTARSEFRADRAALELVSPASQEETILVYHEGDDRSSDVLTETLSELGLHQIDAMDLAQALRRPVSVGAIPADLRRIAIHEDLLDPGYDFTRQSAFPLFVAHSMRWLARVTPFAPRAAAGEGIAVRPGRFVGPTGRVQTARLGWLFAGASGSYAAADHIVEVSLLDRFTTEEPPADRVALFEARGVGGHPWFVWIGLTALALGLLEWVLYRRGSIP